jgi:hypothetical protein
MASVGPSNRTLAPSCAATAFASAAPVREVITFNTVLACGETQQPDRRSGAGATDLIALFLDISATIFLQGLCDVTEPHAAGRVDRSFYPERKRLAVPFAAIGRKCCQRRHVGQARLRIA